MRKPLSNSLAIGLFLIAVIVLNMLFLGHEANAQSAPDVYYNTFEYPDMRSTFSWTPNYWDGSGPVPLGAGEEPSQPAGVYTGSANLGSNQSFPPVYVNNSSICRTQWCIRYDMSTLYGSQLYYLTLGNILPNQTTQHLFYRAYQKFPVGYQFASGKLNYMRDYNGTTVIVKQMCPDTGACSSPNLVVEVGTPSANYYCNKGLSCTITGDNQWHALEAELDPNGGGANAATIRVWRDGNLVLEYCSSCSQRATISTPLNPGGIAFGEYTTPAQGGGGPAVNQSFWLDDLAVSRQRIGPVSGTALSPPTEPEGLTLH